MYSVINDALNSGDCLDLVSVDINKCYDEIMYCETHNDVYDAGVKDTNFFLMSKLDEESYVKVKTPVGMTENFVIKKSILQGPVLVPIKCSTQTDTLERDCLNDNSNLNLRYKYKDLVGIPPLGLMDDVLTISKCGLPAMEMIAVVNAKN